MKTIITEQIYTISGEDEGGLIPANAILALVTYDDQGPKKVYFKPRMSWSPKTDSEETRYSKELLKESRRINPKWTREEIMQIANALEKALNN